MVQRFVDHNYWFQNIQNGYCFYIIDEHNLGCFVSLKFLVRKNLPCKIRLGIQTCLDLLCDKGLKDIAHWHWDTPYGKKHQYLKGIIDRNRWKRLQKRKLSKVLNSWFCCNNFLIKAMQPATNTKQVWIVRFCSTYPENSSVGLFYRPMETFLRTSCLFFIYEVQWRTQGVKITLKHFTIFRKCSYILSITCIYKMPNLLSLSYYVVLLDSY